MVGATLIGADLSVERASAPPSPRAGQAPPLLYTSVVRRFMLSERKGPGPDKSASGDALLSLPSYQALREERDHRRIERRKILGAATCHPVAILDHLLVHPVPSGVANVVLEGRPARQRAAFDQTGRDQQPWRMTDGCDWLTGIVELFGKALRFRLYAQ